MSPEASVNTVSIAFDPERLDEPALRSGLDAAEPSELRVAPLLQVSGRAGFDRTVVIGYCIITAPAKDEIQVRVIVQAAWTAHHSEGGRGRASAFAVVPISNVGDANPSRRRPSVDRVSVSRDLEQFIVEHLSSTPSADPASSVSSAAKALSEGSRGMAGELRELRYVLEEELARIAGGPQASSQASAVGALLQLGVVADRARDIVREIEREGLYLHLTEPDIYHAYRQLQDPRLLTGVTPATQKTAPWIRQHDAAIRQCRAMLSQLDEECRSIRALLNAAASISSSHEADTQARFNVIAAIASIALGLPALVLALYGATVMLPMDESRLPLFLPVVIALMTAAAIAVWQGIALRRGFVWIGVAVLVLALVGVLLFWAGTTASSAAGLSL
ncbi:hypothetical protein [Pseudoclavibacter sp. Z016]|uniref:hypothetical protein n=1 Tax=Pseudoclavibacter sp. Z016 TaxID=2080581 RepID=UPI000CE8742B|nr:hypothetical protein [Pseudoclavibacter sp. Z016]PPF77148.1 hypothetical protein C5B99_04060 [Pseudoclavibacter sp. Z016]